MGKTVGCLLLLVVAVKIINALSQSWRRFRKREPKFFMWSNAFLWRPYFTWLDKREYSGVSSFIWKQWWMFGKKGVRMEEDTHFPTEAPTNMRSIVQIFWGVKWGRIYICRILRNEVAESWDGKNEQRQLGGRWDTSSWMVLSVFVFQKCQAWKDRFSSISSF